MDDTVIPTIEEVVKQIVSDGIYELYMERMRKMTYNKDGSVKSNLGSIEEAQEEGIKEAKEFIRQMDKRLNQDLQDEEVRGDEV